MADAERPSGRLSAARLGLPLLRRARRGLAVIVTTSRRATSNVAMEHGLWLRRSIAGAAAAAPVAAPAPPRRVRRDELRDRMLELREGCDEGDRRACVRLGIIIGENRERRAAWRREHPEVFFYER